jgi:hypothetical protein
MVLLFLLVYVFLVTDAPDLKVSVNTLSKHFQPSVTFESNANIRLFVRSIIDEVKSFITPTPALES